MLTQLEYLYFRQLLLRYHTGEPIEYILGTCEFYKYSFFINSNVLIPRHETEIIVDEVLKLKPNARVLELGTGSGCIAISCKLERPDLAITAVDIDNLALSTAMLNAASLKATINFLHSNWYSQLDEYILFDAIIANPPYIAYDDNHLKNLVYEPLHALTDFDNGYFSLAHIIKYAPSYLVKGGVILLEIGYQQFDSIASLCELHKFVSIIAINDLQNIKRVCKAYNRSDTY